MTDVALPAAESTPKNGAAGFVMHQMRRVLRRYPDLGAGYVRQVDAIEANAMDQPHLCLTLARTLMETCFKTIAQERGSALPHSFKVQAETTLACLHHGLDGHSREQDISTAFGGLRSGLTAVAESLGRLSNIEGLRHGGPAHDPAFDLAQSAFFATVVDAMCAFCIESHRAETKPEQPTLEDAAEFNAWLDETYPLEVANVVIPASWALFGFDFPAYRAALADWRPDEDAE